MICLPEPMLAFQVQIIVCYYMLHHNECVQAMEASDSNTDITLLCVACRMASGLGMLRLLNKAQMTKSIQHHQAK